MVFPCFPCCLLGESCRINLAKKLDLEPLEGVPKDHQCLNALDGRHGFCIVDMALLKRLGSKCIDESPGATLPMQFEHLRTLNILGFKGSAFGLHLIRQFWDPFFAPLICTVLRLYRQGQLPPVGRAPTGARCDRLPRW